MRLKALNVALFFLSAALPSMSNADELQEALMQLYSGHSSATIATQYAAECNPGERAKHTAVYKKWLQSQKLTGYRELLDKALGAKVAAALASSEQQTLLPKMRKTFPNCLTNMQLQTLLNSDMMNLRSSNADAHQIVTTALGSPTAVVSGARVVKPIAGPAVGAGNKRALEGVYMQQTATFGFSFTAYAVFKDGTMTDDLNGAFGGGKMRMGRWQRSGNGFSVTWDDGKRETLSGSTFYRTFPAGNGETLSGKYTHLSTGGNVALGGNVMTFDAETIYFKPNGQFSAESSRGGSSSAGAAVSRGGGSGRYSLKGHTITLQYDSGQTRTIGFYYFPENGRKTVDTIGIGNNVYSHR
jgi:hypothetical protein